MMGAMGFEGATLQRTFTVRSPNQNPLPCDEPPDKLEVSTEPAIPGYGDPCG